MKTRAAICWETGAPWSVEEIDLDEPGPSEVLVKIHASGMCHSDEHITTGDLPFVLPMIGGHEGAGVVEKVGADVRGLAPGDHVVFSFVPSCGRCVPCATGHSNLCDMGAKMAAGLQPADDTSRHHAKNGADLTAMCMIGTFSDYTVANEASCVKIEKDIPLELACLLGCGVITGWGSAVYAGGVKPGDVVAVVGVGGIGGSAIQGAKIAGARHIFAIDPVDNKRDRAAGLGATHTAASMAEAIGLINEVSWGHMADVVVMAMGTGDGSQLATALAMCAKGGKVVVTNIHKPTEITATVSLLDLTLTEKKIVGALFGSANPRADIPKLLHLFRAGKLDLQNMVTRTYPLEDVNKGYEDMREGRNIRGVLLMNQ